jgi:hypothetical protein
LGGATTLPSTEAIIDIDLGVLKGGKEKNLILIDLCIAQLLPARAKIPSFATTTSERSVQSICNEGCAFELGGRGTLCNKVKLIGFIPLSSSAHSAPQLPTRPPKTPV